MIGHVEFDRNGSIGVIEDRRYRLNDIVESLQFLWDAQMTEYGYASSGSSDDLFTTLLVEQGICPQEDRLLLAGVDHYWTR